MNKMVTVDSDLFFAKVKYNAIIPSKRDEDGAMDVYACFEQDHLIIDPHETRMIPTGIASAFSPKYVAILKERGSNDSKGIAQRCGVIDSGYRNEWFVPLTNTNDRPVVITKHPEMFEEGQPLVSNYHANNEFIVYPYSKAIAQVMFVEVPKLDTHVIPYEDLKQFKSERGLGALGSSGK